MKLHLFCWCAATVTLLSLGTLGCSVQGPTKEETTGSAPTAVAASEDQPSDSRLLEIANSYKNYRQFNDVLYVAPALCAPGFTGDYMTPIPGFSTSTDSRTHGRKLYWLFIKEVPAHSEPGNYVIAGKPNPVGQVLVKEAWVAEEVKDNESTKENRRGLALKDGRFYRPAEKAALFIMYKLDPRTPGTDEGWVYGTVSADGKTVTSAGRVQSCMNCHQDAPHDRLFGVAKK
jgi:hypothetical protein